MFNDVKVLAEQVGWPLATILFLLVLGDKLGILSIKVGGKPKTSDVDERIDRLITAVNDLGLKVARIEAILEERGR